MTKRIEVTGHVVLNFRTKGGVERFSFAPGRSYDVSDEVAAHSYLVQYLRKVEDIEEKPRRRVRTKKESSDGS